MNSKSNVRKGNQGFRSGLTVFFRKLLTRISNLFQPEEVEVTFKVEGKNITYTYTEVEHKQVA